MNNRFSGGRLRGRRVLCVDDLPEARRSVCDALEGEGCETREAHDGVAGLEALEAFEPDLACINMVMPRLDGVGMLREMRSRHGFKHRVLMTTSGVPADWVLSSLRLGAMGILFTPFDPGGLVESVADAIECPISREEMRRRSSATLVRYLVRRGGRMLPDGILKAAAGIEPDALSREGLVEVAGFFAGSARRNLDEGRRSSAGPLADLALLFLGAVPGGDFPGRAEIEAAAAECRKEARGKTQGA
jgi:CheY-like chemotaxis protein